MKTIFYNGRVITPARILFGGVEVEDGVITRVFEGDDFEHTDSADASLERVGFASAASEHTDSAAAGPERASSADTSANSEHTDSADTSPERAVSAAANFARDSSGSAGRLIDCRGNYVSPGFIDTHIHGAGGADFMDATPEAVAKIATISANHGTTGLLGTTLSSSRDKIEKALANIAAAMKAPRKGASILGAHLEGNYFNMAQRGAQNPAFIYPPREEEYAAYMKLADIKMVTAAPEIEGALALAHYMQQRNVCVSIGHSCATYEQVAAGIDAGFTHATHAYNGMSFYSNTNYYPAMGTCESVLLRDEITLEVIADGKHVSPPMLQLMYKLKGAENMHAVTDAVMADMPEGDYNLGGLETMVTDGVCMLKDRTSFAGSIATTDRLLRTLHKQAHIPLADAVKMLTSTPARVIGLQASKGRLAAGYDADINVFDEDINILATMIMGEMYQNRL